MNLSIAGLPFRPPRHRCLQRYLPGSSEGVAMEGLMLEILISLCQTGAHIYGMALATIGDLYPCDLSLFWHG